MVAAAGSGNARPSKTERAEDAPLAACLRTEMRGAWVVQDEVGLRLCGRAMAAARRCVRRVGVAPWRGVITTVAWPNLGCLSDQVALGRLERWEGAGAVVQQGRCVDGLPSASSARARSGFDQGFGGGGLRTQYWSQRAPLEPWSLGFVLLAY
jgi:hypothetical protein